MVKITFQNKLIIFSMCLLIPLTIFTYYLIKENAAYSKNQLINNTVGVSEVVRTNVDIFLEDTKTLLLALTQNQVVKNKMQRETMSYFIDIQQNHPGILNLFAAHQDGKIFASVVWNGEDPADISSRKEFREALQTGTPTLSGRITSRATGEMALSVMVPIVSDSGVCTGVLGAEISVNELQNKLISDADAQRNTTIAITDANGVILVHSNYKYVYEETNLSGLQPLNMALQGKHGIMRWQDSGNGEVYWVAYLPTRSFHGAIVVLLPDAATKPPVRTIMFRLLDAFILIIVFVISLSIFFARQTTKPIKQLAAATKVMTMENPRQRVEIKSRDEIGELANAFNTMSTGLADHIEKLAAANEQIARKEQELRRLLSHLVRVQEEERARIAADIHDGVIQMVVGALFETTASFNLLEQNSATASLKSLRNSMDLLSKTITEMQRVIFNLRPPVLEDLGLFSALKWQASMIQSIYQCPVNVKLSGDLVKLDAMIEVIIYRIVQEGVWNAIKHSGASEINIDVCFDSSKLVIFIKDNGHGFELLHHSGKPSGGYGLIAMKERAYTIGASLTINSRIDTGTVIIMEIDLKKGYRQHFNENIR